MAKVKSFGVLSYAKLRAVILAIAGLIAGILYSVGGAIYDVLTTGLNWGTALAFFALIGMPVVFAVFGFLSGVIEAFLYNGFTKWFGGIELDFE